ncbi:MAG: hypothetical protein LRZ85_06390 [Alphaproteobacteria bacterium]|nr:hypothetical protein [Alphaproteobacteria bacterium]MCD8519952.1 hypothetical protein [Alphaproteobacteria bacterium]MCD8526408.1 hypothetical protein [Alphaproteobacteria bacterium]MCD8571553.1 hypothetical protein [Alphaproteobacteria bacterium]
MTLLILFSTVTATLAQDALFTVPEADPMARILTPEKTDLTPRTGPEALDLYLRNCSAVEHPTLDEERHLGQCLCTASLMKDRFSEADTVSMFGNTLKSQKLRDDALKRAFAPCMADTINDLTLSECNSGGQMDTLHYQNDVCACYAQSMRATLSKKAEWMADEYISYYKSYAPDPLAFYMNSPRLEEDMTYNFRKCLGWYETGRKNNAR